MRVGKPQKQVKSTGPQGLNSGTQSSLEPSLCFHFCLCLALFSLLLINLFSYSGHGCWNFQILILKFMFPIFIAFLQAPPQTWWLDRTTIIYFAHKSMRIVTILIYYVGRAVISSLGDISWVSKTRGDLTAGTWNYPWDPSPICLVIN